MSDYQKNITRQVQASEQERFQYMRQGAQSDQEIRDFVAQIESDKLNGRQVVLGPSKILYAELSKEAREARVNQDKGLKYDTEKEPLSLLSRIWLLGISRVMAFGARKYAAHNWRSGLERSRLVSAALRHILAYNEGEDLDPETGLSHLDHASCCLMFAREMHETRPDLDDRYKGAKK